MDGPPRTFARCLTYLAWGFFKRPPRTHVHVVRHASHCIGRVERYYGAPITVAPLWLPCGWTVEVTTGVRPNHLSITPCLLGMTP
jgi:hypothetical protein